MHSWANVVVTASLGVLPIVGAMLSFTSALKLREYARAKVCARVRNLRVAWFGATLLVGASLVVCGALAACETIW